MTAEYHGRLEASLGFDSVCRGSAGPYARLIRGAFATVIREFQLGQNNDGSSGAGSSVE